MKVNRLADLKEYEAKGHFDMSYFLPGGGTTHTQTPLEKVYVGVEGELTIVTDDDENVLTPMDSCYLAPNEARSIINRTNTIASILVIMPYPPKD